MSKQQILKWSFGALAMLGAVLVWSVGALAGPPQGIQGNVTVVNIPLPVEIVANVPESGLFFLQEQGKSVNDSEGTVLIELPLFDDDTVIETIDITVQQQTNDLCSIRIQGEVGDNSLHDIFTRKYQEDDPGETLSSNAENVSLAPGLLFKEGSLLRYAISASILNNGFCVFNVLFVGRILD